MIVCRLLGCLLGTRMSPGFLKVLAMRFQMLDAHGQGVYCMHVLFLVDKGTLSTEVKDCKVCEVLPGSNKHDMFGEPCKLDLYIKDQKRESMG